MKAIILLSIALTTYASMLDFLTLDKAKEAYEQNRFDEASRHYGALAHDGNSEVLFNLGDSQYRQGDYEEALESFQQVTDPALQHQKHHNMGNSYAQLGQIDEAIKAYEEALSLKQDPDTQFNLDLLKKEKEQQDQENQDRQDQENQDRQDQEKKENEKQSDQNDQDGQGDPKDQKSGDDNDDQEEASKEAQQRSDQEKQKQSESKTSQDKDEQDKQEQSAQGAAEEKEAPISDMEERKYTRMLDQRGVNTLMLPIDTKGEDEDEQHPW